MTFIFSVLGFIGLAWLVRESYERFSRNNLRRSIEKAYKEN